MIDQLPSGRDVVVWSCPFASVTTIVASAIARSVACVATRPMTFGGGETNVNWNRIRAGFGVTVARRRIERQAVGGRDRRLVEAMSLSIDDRDGLHRARRVDVERELHRRRSHEAIADRLLRVERGDLRLQARRDDDRLIHVHPLRARAPDDAEDCESNREAQETPEHVARLVARSASAGDGSPTPALGMSWGCRMGPKWVTRVGRSGASSAGTATSRHCDNACMKWLRFALIVTVACSRTELDAPLSTAQPLPGGLRPIAPLSTSTVTTRRPTFHWTGGDGAQVEVCSTRACDVIEATATSSGTSATITTDLSPGVHFFRLHPLVNGAPTKDTSPVWEFRVPHVSAPRDTSWGVFPDFDGDGFADLVVRPNVAFAVEIYPGSPSAISDGKRVEIVIPDPNLVGEVVASGDLDGDGFGDLVVTRSAIAPSTPGVVYVFRGGPKGIVPGDPWITIDPPSDASNVNFGIAASSAGDLDGDGYADFLVSATKDVSGDAGRIYVYRGGPNGPAATPTTTLHSDGNEDFGDGAFAEAGDVNGDGFPDLVVTSANLQFAPHDPKAYLYLGSATGPSDATRTSITTLASDRCVNVSPTPADFDGDGLPDVVLAVDGCDAPVGPGVMMIFEGSKPPKTVTPPPGGFSGFGYANFRAGGDVNGDGYDDLVAGMEIGDPQGAIVFWGSSAGIDQNDQTVFDVAVDPTGRNVFGLTVSDLDGDALDDITVAPITAAPITVFSLSQGSLTAKTNVTPPGATQFYEPILR